MVKVFRFISALFVLLFSAIVFFSNAPKVQATAGINEYINFQGKVANLNGTNVSNGSYNMIFRLYKASSGGVAQWTETWNGGTSQVTITDGVFQVALGTHSSLSSLDWNDDAWYLTVEFNGDGEMDPRIRLTAVPFAQNAKTVAGLTVQDSAGGADTTGTLKVADGSTLTFSADFTTSGDDALIFTTSAATNVTLPTTGTLATLAGSEIFTNKTIGSTGLTFSGATTDVTTASNEDLTLTAAGTGDVIISADADTQFRIVSSAAPGVDIMDLTNAGQGAVTTGVDGLSVTFVQGDDADATDTNAGLHVAITNSSDNADTLYGVQIDGITGSAATETALSIGAGWDTGIDMNANTIVNIGNSGTDFTSTGGLTLAGDFTANANTIIGDAAGDTVTANAAAWTFSSDTTVALSGGVDGLNFDSNTLSIDATNNRVGIGTAAPGATFEVVGNTRVNTGELQLYHSGTNPNIVFANGGGAVLGTVEWNSNNFEIGNLWDGTDEASSVIFYADNAEKMRLTGTGKLGIGTTGPDAKLESLAITGEQLRLTYTDGSVYTGMTVDSGGDLTIVPSGGEVNITGALVTSGDIAVNGDDITSDGTSLKIQVGGTGTTAIAQIGAGGAGSTTPDYFALDVKSDTGDPAGGFEGAMYYNTFDNVFRCYQSAAWTNCIGSGGTTTLQQAYDATTPTILTDASGDIIFQLIGGATDTQFEIAAVSAPEIDMVNLTNASQGTVTDAVDGLSIAFTQGNDADATDTNAGLHVAITNSSDDADTLYGIQIDGITGAGATETALSIGAGWDTGINLNANTLVNIGDSGTDFTSTGGLTLAEILTVNDDVDVNLAAGENATFTASAVSTVDLVAITNSNQGTATTGVDGLDISFTAASGTTTNAGAHITITDSGDAGDTISGLQITAGTASGGTQYGISIDTITGGAGTETALYIASGWDTGIDLNANIITNIGDAATDFTATGGLSLADDLDMTSDPILNIGNTGTDFDTSGGLTLAADLAVNGDDITSDGTSLKIETGGTGTTAVLQVGQGGAGSGTPDYFALDVKSDTGDPGSGAEGYMYYNTFDNKFRCYQSAAWTDCIGSGGTTTLQQAYDATTPTILTDASGDIIFQLIGGATDTQFEIAAVSAPEIDMVNLTNAGFGVGTDGVDGLSINFVQSSGTNITNSAAHLTITGSGDTGDTVMGLRITAVGATNNTQYGAYISSITGGAGAETALYIGSGWDTGIDMNTNIMVNIGHADTDFTATGGLTVGGDVLTVNDDVDVNLAGGENVTILDTAGSTADMLFLSSNGQSVVTNGVDAIGLVFTQGTDGDATDTNAGLHLDFNSSSAQADTLYGVWVGTITAGAATEVGLNVGSGWDRGLAILDANTTSIYLASTDGDAASGITFGSATPVQLYRSAAGEMTITDGSGNSFVFDTVNGPDYAGTARPQKRITLSPEYAGAILTAYYGAGTDTNVTGSMTSDTDTTQGTTIRNYYEWNRSQGTAQHFYTIAVRVTLPADFAAWNTSNALQVSYVTESATNTNSDLDVRIYNENDATIVASSTDQASTSWTTVTIDDSSLDDGASSEWDAAGETAVIYLRMGSISGNYVHVGDIVLNYLGKF